MSTTLRPTLTGAWQAVADGANGRQIIMQCSRPGCEFTFQPAAPAENERGIRLTGAEPSALFVIEAGDKLYARLPLRGDAAANFESAAPQALTLIQSSNT